MSCYCNSTSKRIIIVRGDDTDFNDRTLLTLRLSSDVLDLSTFTGSLTLLGLETEFLDLTQDLVINYTAEETMTLPYGNIQGVLRLYDTTKRVETIISSIPFTVISEMDARSVDFKDNFYTVNIKDGDETILNISVESAISVSIGQVQTLQPDEPAYVTNVGSNNHLILNFGIPQGVQGVQGERGATGANGQDGRDGTNGRSAELQIGVVQTLQPTQSAYVINTGTSLNAVLDFGIPRGEKGEQGERGLQGIQGEQGIQGIQGEKGDKGDKGDKGNTGATGEAGQAATVAVGTVATLQPNQSAYVTNSGTSSSAVFNFGIPKGEKGDTGSQGEQGEKGDTGASGQAATVQVGTVTTLSPSESAYVQNVGTTSQAIFNFGIPKGDTGSATGVSWGTIDGTLSNQTDLQNALNGKQDTISDLSTIRSGAEAGATAVQPSSLATVATSGSYNDLSDKPSIPSSQVQSNWTEADSSKVDYIKNKPTLATVATTGSYSDLSDKPTIPSKTSDLNNDSGFITSSALSGYATETWVGQQGYITGITSSMVTTALGFIPYNSSNPNGYQENVIESIKVNGSALTPTNKAVDITVPSAVTETTVSGWGFTKNTGTVTSVNNISPVSGNVSIDLSVYQTKANLVTSVSSSSTDSQYASAKCLYDLCGDIETLINAL